MERPDEALTHAELAILNACADHYEVFYYPFAEVNYGGQVVSVEPDDPARSSFPQIEAEGPWEITVPGEEVARYMARLIRTGLLQCWRVSDDPEEGRGLLLNPQEQTSGLYRERVEVTQPDEQELSAYEGYSATTFDEHMQRFGYGPHEFRITEAGIREIRRPIYDELYGD